MKIEDIPWDRPPEETLDEKVYASILRARSAAVHEEVVVREKKVLGRLLRPSGKPLRRELPEILRRQKRIETAYLEARREGKRQRILSRRRDVPIQFDPPLPITPRIEVQAKMVLGTRGQSRRVRTEFPFGERLGTFPRIHSVAVVSSSLSDQMEFIPLESGAASHLAGGFPVETKSSAGVRPRLRGIGRERELKNALGRRNRVGL